MKFLSRKFILPVIYTIVSIANSEFNLNLPLEIIGGLFGTFIAGETVIDSINVAKNGKNKKEKV